MQIWWGHSQNGQAEMGQYKITGGGGLFEARSNEIHAIFGPDSSVSCSRPRSLSLATQHSLKTDSNRYDVGVGGRGMLPGVASSQRKTQSAQATCLKRVFTRTARKRAFSQRVSNKEQVTCSN